MQGGAVVVEQQRATPAVPLAQQTAAVRHSRCSKCGLSSIAMTLIASDCGLAQQAAAAGRLADSPGAPLPPI